MSALAFVSNTLLMSETNPRFTSSSYSKLSNSNDTEQGIQRQQHATASSAAENAIKAEGSDLQAPGFTSPSSANYVQLTVLESATPSGTVADSADVSQHVEHVPETNLQRQHGMQQFVDASHTSALHQSHRKLESPEENDETDSTQTETAHLLSFPRRTSSQEEEEEQEEAGQQQQQQQQTQHAVRSNRNDLNPKVGEELAWYKQGLVLVCLAGGGLIVLCVNYLDELAPIFASAQASQGGLGMTASAFAWPLAFGGAMLMLYSIFAYPELQKKWGRMYCCQVGLLASACAALLIPTSHFFASYWWLAQMFMFVAIGIRSIAKVTSLSSSTIIVNTVAPMSQIGSVNGAGQTLNALARSVGPLVAGVIWGTSASSHIPGKQYLPFIGSICLLMITLGLYTRIKLQD